MFKHLKKTQLKSFFKESSIIFISEFTYETLNSMSLILQDDYDYSHDFRSRATIILYNKIKIILSNHFLNIPSSFDCEASTTKIKASRV